MNEIKRTILLAGDKFTYTAYGPYIKNKERTKKLKNQVIQDKSLLEYFFYFILTNIKQIRK